MYIKTHLLRRTNTIRGFQINGMVSIGRDFHVMKELKMLKLKVVPQNELKFSASNFQ